MKLRIFSGLLLAFVVAGCVTTPEERRAKDEEKCRSYGFTKRNDAFAACLQRIDIARQASLRNNNYNFNGWDGPVVYGPAVVVRR